MSRRYSVMLVIVVAVAFGAPVWHYVNRRDSRYSYERVTYERAPLPDATARFLFPPAAPASDDSESTELSFQPLKKGAPVIVEGVVRFEKNEPKGESFIPFIVVQFYQLSRSGDHIVTASTVVEMRRMDDLHYAYRADIDGINVPGVNYVEVLHGADRVGFGRTVIE